MIFNAGSKYSTGTGGTYGSITLSGNGTYNLSPATSGTYAGIVFFEPIDNTKAITVTASASGITGTIYAPAAQLSESNSGALNASLIVDTLTISGNGMVGGPSTVASASAIGGPATTNGATTEVTSTIETAAVLDQNMPSTIPIKMRIKLTVAPGDIVNSSRLPVVSMSAVGSVGSPVPQKAPGSSQPGNAFTFDPAIGADPFNMQTKRDTLGS